MKQVVVKTLNHVTDSCSEFEIGLIIYEKPHPNLVEFLPGTTESKMVMTFYPAGDLYDFTTQHHHLSRAIIRQKFTDIVHGVLHLHQLGIAHRNLSLEHILLDEHAQCHISSFALAIRNASDCRGCVGNPFYIPPEMTEDSYDGYQVDLWALGIMLFIMCTGNPPFSHAKETDPHFRQWKRVGLREHIGRTWTTVDVSEQAIDLMEQLLVFDPSERVSIQQVVKHDFIVR